MPRLPRPKKLSAKQLLKQLQPPPPSSDVEEAPSEILSSSPVVGQHSQPSPPGAQPVLESPAKTPRKQNKRKQANPQPLPPNIQEEDEATDASEPRIRPDVEERLVDWFADHPIFYDQRLKEFKERGKRDRLLRIISEEVGLSSDIIWGWFRNMRTVYGKLKKKKSGQAAETMTPRQQWTTRRLAFLDSHLKVVGESRKLGHVSIFCEQHKLPCIFAFLSTVNMNIALIIAFACCRSQSSQHWTRRKRTRRKTRTSYLTSMPGNRPNLSQSARSERTSLMRPYSPWSTGSQAGRAPQRSCRPSSEDESTPARLTATTWPQTP